MKMLIMKIGILIAIFLLMACESFAKIETETAYFKSEIESGRMDSNINQVELTPAQDQILTHAENKVNAFIIKWRDYLANPDLAALTEDEQKELLADYKDLKVSYADLVNNVAMPNWEKYDPITRINLSSFGMHAETLDEAVDSLIEAKEQRHYVEGIMQYVMAFGKIANSLK